MGSTLTNTQPKDTYKGILKTSDTTELSGTAKYVSDGNGNDSPLALSTSAVGIGTSSPDAKLVVLNGVGEAETAIFSGTEQSRGLSISILNQGGIAQTGVDFNAQHTTSSMISFSTNSIERARITENGLTFNGDTAAANALDDYEEGTWTMGIAFGGSSTGNAYSSNTGTYVKIGKQVTCTGIITLSTKGSATGSASLTGLPFTIATGSANYAAVTLRMNAVSFANQYQGYAALGTTYIDIEETTEAGVVTGLNNTNFTTGSAVMVSVTYFV